MADRSAVLFPERVVINVLTINTNVASLNAQNNLASSQNALQTSLQHLSSGLRINSSKDDAAGLYTAELMSSTIRGTDQAVHNASDGISLAQTAEGALAQIASNLQRIREIAVQSANSTVQDRSGLQAETNQLTQEISRIVQTSKFNGVSLLSSTTTLTFQVGANGASTNQVAVATTDLTAVGGGSTAEKAAAQAVVDAASTGTANWDAMDQATIYMMSAPGVTTVFAGGALFETTLSNSFTSSDAASAAAVATYNAMQAAFNAGGGSDAVGGTTTKAALVASGQAVTDSYTPSNPILNSYNSDLSGTGTIDVSSQNSASTALASLDADITKISSTRSTFGAIQNRFDAVIANLQSYSENLTASRSRIMDADFASETASLTRAQVLQQAGTAVLSQANAIPQSVLALLR